MTPEQRKAKLRWHCRRGMLELDVMLERFVMTCLERLTEHELDTFEALLTYPDPDLYAWLMGYEHPPTEELADFVALIRSYHHRSSIE